MVDLDTLPVEELEKRWLQTRSEFREEAREALAALSGARPGDPGYAAGRALSTAVAFAIHGAEERMRQPGPVSLDVPALYQIALQDEVADPDSPHNDVDGLKAHLKTVMPLLMENPKADLVSIGMPKRIAEIHAKILEASSRSVIMREIGILQEAYGALDAAREARFAPRM